MLLLSILRWYRYSKVWLRRKIEASGKVGKALFVDDIQANAKGFEKAISVYGEWQVIVMSAFEKKDPGKFTV